MKAIEPGGLLPDRAEAGRRLGRLLAAMPGLGGAVVLAVPVAPAEALDALRGEVDEIVCLAQPSPFHAVGAHYADFHQASDDEVIAALDAAALAAPRKLPEV